MHHFLPSVIVAKANTALKSGISPEQELRILRAFVEKAPMGVLMLDRRMRGIQVSQRWLDDVSMTRDYVIGRGHYGCFPDLPAHWKDLHRRGLAGESLPGNEERYLTPDGRTHWVTWSITPWGDSGETTGGILISSDDVTTRIEAQEEANRGQATIRALLESTTQSIIAIDPAGKIVPLNGTTGRMFGYSREELLGQPLDLLVPESNRARHREYHKIYFANMQSRPMGLGLDLLGRRKDGTTFPVEIALSGIETSDGKLAVAFVNDIDRKSVV